MCLLEIIIDHDCPSRVFRSFVEGWVSAGANNPVLYEWMSEKINKITKNMAQSCKLHIQCTL